MINFPATQSSMHVKTRLLCQEVWEVIQNLSAYRATVHMSTSETHRDSCREGLFRSMLDNFLASLDPKTAYAAAYFNTVLFNTLPLSLYCVKSYEEHGGGHGEPARVPPSWSWEGGCRDHPQTLE